MAHGIISTRFLSRDEVQRELYNYNRSFFGSWNRRIESLVSRNKVKRRVYRYMVRKCLASIKKSGLS